MLCHVPWLSRDKNYHPETCVSLVRNVFLDPVFLLFRVGVTVLKSRVPVKWEGFCIFSKGKSVQIYSGMEVRLGNRPAGRLSQKEHRPSPGWEHRAQIDKAFLKASGQSQNCSAKGFGFPLLPSPPLPFLSYSFCHTGN